MVIISFSQMPEVNGQMNNDLHHNYLTTEDKRILQICKALFQQLRVDSFEQWPKNQQTRKGC
jgi:hypothetical protein